MGSIEWVDDNNIGIKEIDDQHKELVVLTNKLFQAIMEERGEEALLDVLNKLREYVEYHFDYEEKLLAEYGFPQQELDAHIAEHEALKEQVHDYYEEFSKEGGTLDIDVFNFLRDWTTNHLRDTDFEYKDFFMEKGLIKL